MDTKREMDLKTRRRGKRRPYHPRHPPCHSEPMVSGVLTADERTGGERVTCKVKRNHGHHHHQ